jgi:hypothetical protein
VGKDGSHLKLVLTDGFITYDAIAFRMGQKSADPPLFIDILFAFERNQYNGNDILQLNIKDIRPADAQRY